MLGISEWVENLPLKVRRRLARRRRADPCVRNHVGSNDHSQMIIPLRDRLFELRARENRGAATATLNGHNQNGIAELGE